MHRFEFVPRFIHSSITPFLVICLTSHLGMAQDDGRGSGPIARFTYDGSIERSGESSVKGALDGEATFVKGLEGQALSVTSHLTYGLDNLVLDGESDFSIQFWVRTTASADKRMVLLSQKNFPSNSLHSQKRAGWVFYLSNGTWAWNMGSGSRRITYERDNGKFMPLNDGRWHQLTMTHDHSRAVVRLYFDGIERALYNIGDSKGFDFTNDSPLAVGWMSGDVDPGGGAPTIESGAEDLQNLVDAFSSLGVDPVQPEELIDLIVDPKRFFDEKVRAKSERLGADGAAFAESMKSSDLKSVRQAESALMKSPYTVHQNREFTAIAPVTELYALAEGKVTIRRSGVQAAATRERLDRPAFDIDDLAVWDRVLSRDDVRDRYARHFEPIAIELQGRVSDVTAAAWNIWHGGKHFTVAKDGWDSRASIAEMIRREGVDLVMMQETYSSGDFVAAELGYYFASGVDWDYLNQGANISVLSRYPIEAIHVPPGATFNNVAVKVTLSESQSLYVMSNWYGMAQFRDVYDFHEARFNESDVTPTLMAGDFNAVPHTDGGESPASQKLLEAGFVDAYRSLYQDVEQYPGASHRGGRRIDQLYYKGAGLTNTSTRLVSSWPVGFPSDHFMIIANFDLRDGPLGR